MEDRKTVTIEIDSESTMKDVINKFWEVKPNLKQVYSIEQIVHLTVFLLERFQKIDKRNKKNQRFGL